MNIINRICPRFTKGFDDCLNVGGMSPNQVLILRGLYDSTHESPLLHDSISVSDLTQDDLKYYSERLLEFKKEVNREELRLQEEAMLGANSSIFAQSLLTLDNEYSDGITKMRRIDMVAELAYQSIVHFSKANGLEHLSYQEIVDIYFSKGSNLFYPIANGVDPKYTVLGQLTRRRNNIKSRLEGLLEKDPSNKEIEQLKHRLEELNKICNLSTKVYPALCVYALATLKDSLDVKINTSFTSVDTDLHEEYEGEINPSITESPTKESWQETEKSSFSLLNKPVRKALYMLKSYDEKGNEIIDDLGYPVYEDAMTMHRSLVDMLHYADSEDDMMKLILEAGKYNKAYKELATRLNNDPALKSDLFQSYTSLTNINYSYLNEDGSIRRLSGINTSKKGIFKAWNHNLNNKRNVFSDSIFVVRDGKVLIDQQRLDDFKQFVKDTFVRESYKEGIFTRKLPSKFSKLSTKDKKEALIKVFRALNINHNEALINTIIAKGTYKSIIRDVEKLAVNDWLENVTTGTAASHIEQKIGGYSFVKDTISNILYSIVKASPKRLDHKVNFLGKKLFNDILPSLTSDILDALKRYTHKDSLSSVNEYLDRKYFISRQFKDSNFGILNRTLKDLYESIESEDPQIQECAKAIIEAMDICRTLGSEEKDFKMFNAAEHLSALMSGFFQNYKDKQIVYIDEQKYLDLVKERKTDAYTFYYIVDKPYYYKGSKVSKKLPKLSYADYSLFIAGDANQLKTVRLPIYSYDECIEALIKLAISEINYYKQERARQIKEGDTKSLTKRIFGFLPFLNDNAELTHFIEVIANPNSTKKERDEALPSKPVEDIIKEGIENFLAKEKKDLETRLQENPELITKLRSLTADSMTDPSKALDLFVANYAVALGTTLQLTMISPALFDNVKDLQKRNKGQHSNGGKLYLKAYNPFRKKAFDDDEGIQKTKIVQDPKTHIKVFNAKYASVIEAMFAEAGIEVPKSFSEVKVADGQGLRLIDSYFKLQCMNGKAKDPKLNAWYAKYKELQVRMLEAGRDTFTKEEIQELADIGYIPQPIKPITQAINYYDLGNGDKMLYAQQHKYAEVILIPEALPKGSRLRAIAEEMRGDWKDAKDRENIKLGKSKIDLVIFDSGVKVGAFGAKRVIFDEKGNQISYEGVKQALRDSFTHMVSLEYTKIQTPLPYHVFEDRLLGSQLRKIMLSGIDKLASYSHIFKDFAGFIKGNHTHIRLSKSQNARLSNFTGEDHIKLYNALISAGYIESFQQFQRLIEDNEALGKALINSNILGSRGNINDALAYTPDLTEEGFYNALFDPIREHDTSSLLLSMYKKLVNKQTMLGGSAVIASSFGISALEEKDSLKYKVDDDGNITWAQGEMPWDLSITNPDGTKTPLDYDTYCDEEGYLRKNEKGEYLLDIDYPGARFVIIYRTPTEEYYSICLIEIVRFTRPVASGGTMKLSPELIAEIGEDFDADKVSIIRHEFKEAKPYFQRLNLTKDQRVEIINKILETHPEFLKEVEPLTELSFSQNQLYDIFSEIYNENENIYKSLKQLRDASGEYKEVEYVTKKGETKLRRIYDHPLNYYFTQSDKIKKIAESKGFEDVADYKNYLVQQAADNLGYSPEVLVTIKEGYYTLDEEAITNAGTTKQKVFSDAATALGIQLKENVAERWELYDPNKTPLENTKVARNNLLFHLMKNRLIANDEVTKRKKHSANGFANASKAARFLRELMFNTSKYTGKSNLKFSDIDTDYATDPEPQYNPLSVNTLLIYNEMNQIADKLIGVFANDNSNAIMASVMHQLELKPENSIKFGSMLEPGVQVIRNGRPTGVGYDLLADKIIYPDGKVVYTSDNVHELIAASVDAVKDPVLNYLGLTPVTASAGALLARLGYRFEDIGLLLNQPIVKEVLKRQEKYGSIDSAITEVTEEFKNIKASETDVTTSILINGITDKTSLKERKDLSDQLAVLKLFSNVMGMASKVNRRFVKLTKNTSANSVASSYSQIIVDSENVDKIVDEYKEGKNDGLIIKPNDKTETPIENSHDLTLEDSEDYLDSIIDNPYAFEQAAYDCNRGVLYSTSHLHPYMTSTYSSIRRKAYEWSLYNYLSPEFIDELHRDIVLKAIATRGDSYFDGSKRMSDGKLFVDYLLDEFPSKLYDLLHVSKKGKTLMSKYPFLEQLDFIASYEDENENFKYTISISSFKDGLKGYKYLISSLFTSMFYAEEKEVRDLARLLIMYSAFTKGFGFSNTSFSEVFGPKIMHNLVINKEGETYSEILNLLLNDALDIDPEDMIIDFVRNHPDDKTLVYPIKRDKDLKEIAEKQLFKLKFSGISTQNLNFEQAKALNLVSVEDKENDTYKPKRFIKIGSNVWVYKGKDTVSKGDTLTYEELVITGNGKTSKIYMNPNNDLQTEDHKVLEKLANITTESEEEVGGTSSNTDNNISELEAKLAAFYGVGNSLPDKITYEDGSSTDFKIVLMATLEKLNDEIFISKEQKLSEEEKERIINTLYSKYTMHNLLSLLAEEYEKIGEIKVLNEKEELIKLC